MVVSQGSKITRRMIHLPVAREKRLPPVARGRIHWDADVDLYTARGPREDRDVTADQAQPLSHADQAEPPLAISPAGVETAPVVGDPEGDRDWAPTQFDPGVPGATVLDDVPQGFLGDAVETQGRISRYRGRDLLGSKINTHAMSMAQLAAQAADGDHEPKLLEFRGVQLV